MQACSLLGPSVLPATSRTQHRQVQDSSQLQFSNGPVLPALQLGAPTPA